jgi:RNA polymerase sigma-70 factor (ECF subfamily)
MLAADAGLAPVTLARADAGSAADEEALVEAVRRNAPGSREAVYHRFKRRVFALATRIAGAAEAEEVAQEAFIRIFRGLPRFRAEAALGTWIYRLTVNVALSHRSRRPPPTEPLDAVAHERLGDAATIGGGAGQGGGLADGDAVLRARLERGLARLPVGYRTVVVLHDIEGLEHEEIAAVLGCHVGTSKSQLHKARARLRAILAEEGVTAAALHGHEAAQAPAPGSTQVRPDPRPEADARADEAGGGG